MDIAPAPAIQFTPEEHGRLMKQWAKMADTLMERDGNNPKFADGGHRIKHNPLLTAAIEEIRDGYFHLFNEKRHLYAQLERGQNASVLQEAIQFADCDIVAHNHESFMRLQQQNYGFTPQRAAEILAAAPAAGKQEAMEPLSLGKADAAKIVGTIIKRSILSFEVTFARDKVPRMHVPHVPLVTDPHKYRTMKEAENKVQGARGL